MFLYTHLYRDRGMNILGMLILFIWCTFQQFLVEANITGHLKFHSWPHFAAVTSASNRWLFLSQVDCWGVAVAYLELGPPGCFTLEKMMKDGKMRTWQLQPKSITLFVEECASITGCGPTFVWVSDGFGMFWCDAADLTSVWAWRRCGSTTS